MAHKISILFYVKNAKATKNGAVPIYLRVTIDGKRHDFSTGKYADPAKWSSAAGKIKGKSEEACSISSHLDALRMKAFSIENILLKQDGHLCPDAFRKKFLGVDDQKRTLIPIFEEHNKRMEALIPQQFSPNTLKKFKTTLKHLQTFLLKKYQLKDIDITKIDLAFIKDFDFYLRGTKSCNNNSTVKYVRNFSKIVRQCYENEWISRDPFYKYEFTLDQVDIEFLSQEELSAMYSKSIRIPRLELVRDIYVFACYTSLAFADIEQLTPDHISIGIDGSKWIFKNRQKTKRTCHIPLLPIAEEIIEKYRNHPKSLNTGKVLPILSNQKMNSYLKEIADICGINKELTFHTSRHTFGTTVTLLNGVPLESVSKMMGHGSLRTTQHYARVLDLKVSEDMRELKSKLQENSLKWSATNKCCNKS